MNTSSVLNSYKFHSPVKWWIILGVLLTGWSVYAQESSSPAPFDWGHIASARTAYWSRDKSFDDRSASWSNSFWLSLSPETIHDFKFKFESFGAVNALNRVSTGPQTDPFVEFREAYVERSFGAFDIRFGRQIIAWGRADKVNPTDVFGTRNLTFLSTDEEDQRLGVGTLQLTYNWDAVRVIGIFQPEWRFPTYPIPPISGVSLRDGRLSAFQPQGGIKLDYTSSAFDASVSFFNGINRTPDLEFKGLNGPTANIELMYRRVRTLGADIAFTQGDYGFRSELAYQQTEKGGNTDAFRQNDQLYGVFGVETTPVENLNLNVQVLGKHTFGEIYSPVGNALLVPLAEQMRFIANQTVRNLWGLTFRPSYKFWNDTAEIETALVYWSQPASGLVRPKASYAINDQLKAIVGGEIALGKESSFFGRMVRNNAVFSELRYSF